MRNFFKIAFLGLVMTFALVPSVFAQSDLTNYTERLLSNFEQEIDTVNNFVSAYENADFENDSSISLFQSKLGSYRNSFNEFLSFYRTATPSDAPTELRDSVNFAIAGTEQILRGINSIDSALDNRSNDELQRGQDSLNAGTAQVNNAISKYNSWVDTHNEKVKTEGGTPITTTADIGADSAFASTWAYAKPLAYIYAYLFIAGLILSFIFRNRLKSLVSGKTKEFKGAPFYGLHLVALFPYLYALLAFCLLIVWDIALIGILYVTNAERIHLGILLGIAIVVFGTAWAILKGFFAGRKRSVLGTKITREEQPKIWETCDKIAKEIGTKTVDEIYISPQPGIGVHLSGGLFSLLIGRTKRTLTIGMPSISSLSVSEMEAILAHEFGHFSNKDTAWNSLTFTMGGALQNSLETIPKPWGGGANLSTLIIALNPALWILTAYRILFSVVTSGFSRMREVFADKTAIALYGYKNFTNGLMRVARNDYVFSSYFVPDMLKMLTEEGKMYTNIFHTMDQTYKSIESNKLTDIDKSILDQEKSSMFDSHPLMKDRMSYAKHFEVEQKHKTDTAEFKTLFKDWDEVSKKISDLYTYYIAVLTGHKFEEDTEKKDTQE
ncbi:MAG: hypothetical protein A3B37_03340 [Candidatus Sungbacteria bacterium RIFCSPLOWO2_01_FULL_59_16]|uniref:Peptidase M48 domain-containing protein n=1 Tax=Candidatus Sungbacteria bacterium RIFCSPLOWO2_01_FULL_59_16 TaxID=1802280 RepID=A0A1G2L9K5_9BACT|nr:MAG: hypothetical protein A3B37_03340 [Candidatus Sungbacteria bacterium RIFCSPLOWO2_01_FULL_59_16]